MKAMPYKKAAKILNKGMKLLYSSLKHFEEIEKILVEMSEGKQIKNKPKKKK